MKRILVGALAALLITLGFAFPNHAAASGCCMEVNVYFDGPAVQHNSAATTICLYGYNQNMALVSDCQTDYPIYTDTYSFPNYWWQSGTNTTGVWPPSYGNLWVIIYYSDGSNDVPVNAVVPYQVNCYGSYWAVVFSAEGITSC